MVAIKNLSLLALASAALAAPAPHRGPRKEVVWHTVIKTAYVTVYPGQAQPARTSTRKNRPWRPRPTTTSVVNPPQEPSPEPQPEPEPETPVVIVTPTPSSTAAASSAPPPPRSTTTSAAPPPPAPSAPAPAPAPPAGGDYMELVTYWRERMGKTKLTRSTKLEGNCLNTVQSGGTKMVHKLNPGTYGQVLAPGDAGDFEHVFVGGWLCELPNDSGMNGICETASKGWNYMGQTGHAEILRSNEYSTIGCANNGHIWCCDVGYA